MSKTNQLWQDEIEAIGLSYAENRLTYEEAMMKLMNRGIEPDEADNMLAAARTPG